MRKKPELGGIIYKDNNDLRELLIKILITTFLVMGFAASKLSPNNAHLEVYAVN